MATIALPPRLKRERRFFSGMALVMAATVFAGFAPSFFLKGLMGNWVPAPILPLTPLVVLHGGLFTIWTLLFVVQTSLVAAGRVDVHRKLGTVGFVLVPVLLVTMAMVSVHGALRAAGPPVAPPASFIAVPFAAVLVFPILAGWALAVRRDPQSHKRLMLLAMIVLMSPAAGRLPLVPPAAGAYLMLFGVANLFLLALVLWDLLTLRRLHRATLWGGLLVVGVEALAVQLWQTEAWLAFSNSVIALGR